MNFNRPWSEFALEVEFDYFGTTRIVQAHNKLRIDYDRLLVLATKHCPRDHHDFAEIQAIAGDKR